MPAARRQDLGVTMATALLEGWRTGARPDTVSRGRVRRGMGASGHAVRLWSTTS
jgi:hypothetical protein